MLHAVKIAVCIINSSDNNLRASSAAVKEFLFEIWTKASPCEESDSVLMVVITGSPNSNASFLTAAD